MIRFLQFTTEDIASNPESAAECLSAAVSRNPGTYVTGVCDIGCVIVIPLEDIPEGHPAQEMRYVFSAFTDASVDGVPAEILARYHAGFTTLGTFRMNDALWGLFAIPASASNQDGI